MNRNYMGRSKMSFNENNNKKKIVDNKIYKKIWGKKVRFFMFLTINLRVH